MGCSGEAKHKSSTGGSTLLIRIHFKQNTNWQGTIQWLEINQTVPFRSVLELNMLMNEAVENTYYQDDERSYRSWNLEHMDKQAVSK